MFCSLPLERCKEFESLWGSQMVVWFTSKGKSVVCESEISLGRTFKGFVLLATPSRGENGVIMFLAAVDISVRNKHLFTSSETVEELGEGRHDC